MVVRIKVACLCELRVLTSVDHGPAQPLGVSGLPVSSSVAVRQVSDEKARRLNLYTKTIINQTGWLLIVQPS